MPGNPGVRSPGTKGQCGDVPQGAGAVRRTTPATGATPGAPHPDFACAYEVAIALGDVRSTEQWARAAWEGAPVPVQWFMLAGWRVVLGLPLGPRRSPDHILGWRIVARVPDETICQLRSRLVDAHNVFRKRDGALVWSTLVTYEGRAARVIWPPVSMLHRLLVRIALRRAATP
jgi:hypothetical protein